MTLLKPLGLIGLSAIIVLIIIYIIKPNYQQKFVSSTFVWKLSLKYKKKRLPTSKLRDIILILCQVLILASCAFILATPVKAAVSVGSSADTVVILDASASMQTKLYDDTRFARAVDKAEVLCSECFAQGGKFSLIKTGVETTTLLSRVDSSLQLTANEAFVSLREENGCTYGSADIDGAMLIAKELLAINPQAKVYLITDNSYIAKPDGVELVNVTLDGEWNVAILNAEVEREEGYYNFYVNVASYGASKTVVLNLDLEGVNPTEANPEGDSTGNGNELVYSVDCSAGKTYTVVFCNTKFKEKHKDDLEAGVLYASYADCGWDISLSSYTSSSVSALLVGEEDSYLVDNSFTVPTPKKNTLKVQYYSTERTKFVETVLDVMREKYYKDLWDLEVHSLAPEDTPAIKGFDMYFFEYYVPDSLPTDGAVFLLSPADSSKLRPMGVTLGSQVSLGAFTYLTTQIPDHPLLKYTVPESIGVTIYTPLIVDDSFDVLMTCGADSVMVAKKQEKTEGQNPVKLFVISFPISYTDLAVKSEMMLFTINAFDYYLPATLTKYTYSVGEAISVNCRGDYVLVGEGDDATKLTEFPTTLSFDLPGSYTIRTILSNKEEVKNVIYVSAPMEESDIFNVEDNLVNPFDKDDLQNDYTDLIFIFAAALTALLFIEWALNLWQGA